MLPGRPVNTTRVLGAPVEWDKDRDGSCSSLAIADVETQAGNAMESAWLPLPDELERLIAGAVVKVGLLGRVHPPIYVSVGEVPKDPI